MKHAFGVKVKDQITGFSGVVTGHTSYITGCSQFLVQPPAKESGEFVEARWFDEDRLEAVEAPRLTLAVKAAGFDIPAPIR